MKKLYFVVIVVFFAVNTSLSQTIFKGLSYGMSKKEAKTEYSSNENAYVNVDLGNGFIWKLFPFGFKYDDKKLIFIVFQPKGSLLGISHDNTMTYLEVTKAFFESKGYNVFYQPDNWQYPLLFHSKYGLLMFNTDKTVMVQLFPATFKQSNGTTTYLPYLKVMNYDWFMKDYNNQLNVLTEKRENTGF